MGTVFGSGAMTASYQDLEETELIIAWGSNTPEAHPIIFNHIRRGKRNGAKLIVIDPRRILLARQADLHLQVKVGTDLALANGIGHIILKEEWYNKEFIDYVTEGFENYRQHVESYNPEYVSNITGIRIGDLYKMAKMYANAKTAVINWTLGITEHRNGADNVFSIINLALLTGHIGKKNTGLNPFRGQNNVQGGGDAGALPNRLPGFFKWDDPDAIERFEKAWQCNLPDVEGLNQAQMLDAMREGKIKGVYIIGENPAQSEANTYAVEEALRKQEIVVVQDILMTRTVEEFADVVLPASSWAEHEGTFTNSERRVQKVERIFSPPGEAMEDIFIVQEIANRLGANWNYKKAEEVWDEYRLLSPAHFGITYEKIEKYGGVQWPSPTLEHPGSRTLHERLWNRPIVGKRAPFTIVDYKEPAEIPDKEYPYLLITGRRLAFYNTGVQTRYYEKELKDTEEFLEINPVDSEKLGITDGEFVSVTSRRGSVKVKARVDKRLQKGNVFMTFHFSDWVPTNVLTSDVYDAKSGVNPFKTTAVKIERL